ncbi:MAG: hypothetical protein Q9209_004233 [Squamulea sp. 1 TL-2023]
MSPGLANGYPSSWTEPSYGHTSKENVPSTPDRSNATTNGFSRSASSTQLDTRSESNVARGDNVVRRTLSENVLIKSLEIAPDSQYRKKINNKVQVPGAANGETTSTKQKTPSKSGTEIAVSQFTLDPLGADEDDILELDEPGKSRTPGKDDKASSISRSFSRFARRSWVSRSRSSSPSPSVLGLEHKQDSFSDIPRTPSSSTLNTSVDSTASDRPPKARRRPLSVLKGKVPFDSTVPSVPAIPTSFSTEKLPVIWNRTLEKVPTLPRSTTWEPTQGSSTDSSRKRDDLSSAFRTLDGDFQKHSRTSSLKSAVVRSALLSFLRTYANHPSNTALRPEDLDRRVNVLNKWWVGLLTMLIGRNGESVSGSDRPTILDAVTSIMVRPEWTLPYQAGHSNLDRNARPFLKSRSTTSLASESSGFLTESIFHNVKNLYAQNLLSQMVYVVEKMSSRSVPASVVTFCGKAAAYAFFYCEGVAEILVRLWATPQEMIRRVLVEHHLPRDADLKRSMNTIVPNFPPGLHCLGFKSVKATLQYLHSRPHFPIATAHIYWDGPWVRRWAGRDTDLFFIFTRSYYNLMSLCLPPDLIPQERLCAPGYVLLHAQLLCVLDVTILQNLNQHPLETATGPPLQNDDLFGEADASASILPLSPVATNRSMAENRLIILLRDYLSGSGSLAEKPKEIFAESFEYLLKAAARRVSVFNYTACFALCDVMEEALAILCRYSTSSQSNYTTLDWQFWLKVCRQMMESQNTMTQLRVYAFLYSLWGTIAAEASRKHQVCLEWLLDEEYFYAHFNHWCPMVRAYYMRLLCWRIGRSDDSSSDLNISILKTFARRLDYVWCTFLYLQDDTLSKGGPRISTAPCSPAPSRHLPIIRNDSQPAPSGMFLTFDSILSQPSSTQPTAYERHSSLNTLTNTKEALANKKSPSVGRKSWSILRNIIPFSTSATDSSLSNVRQNTTKTKSSNQPTPSNIGGPPSTNHAVRQENSMFQAYSFKFSLEWIGDEKSPFGKEQYLYRPQLPISSSKPLAPPDIDLTDLSLYKPQGAAVNSGKYAGRALAEWELVLAEFKEFSERRRMEGVPSISQIETPTLGVETFRRPG